MPIKTSSAKAKARLLQQYICRRITEVFNLAEGDCESRSMGASGVDVMLSPVARKAFPVSVEAKKTKKVPSRAELQQSKGNAYPNTIAGVAWCPHGCGPDKTMIMFDLEDFLAWWKENND